MLTRRSSVIQPLWIAIQMKRRVWQRRHISATTRLSRFGSYSALWSGRCRISTASSASRSTRSTRAHPRTAGRSRVRGAVQYPDWLRPRHRRAQHPLVQLAFMALSVAPHKPQPFRDQRRLHPHRERTRPKVSRNLWLAFKLLRSNHDRSRREPTDGGRCEPHGDHPMLCGALACGGAEQPDATIIGPLVQRRLPGWRCSTCLETHVLRRGKGAAPLWSGGG